MKTANLGLNLIPLNSPDYEAGQGAVALMSANFAALDAKSGVEVEAASGAIGITQGIAIITKPGAAAAMTLAVPTPGLPANGGNDGQTLSVLSTTAFPHTITTPANGINGAKRTLTFTNVSDFAELKAYNGTWYVAVLSTGVALS